MPMPTFTLKEIPPNLFFKDEESRQFFVRRYIELGYAWDAPEDRQIMFEGRGSGDGLLLRLGRKIVRAYVEAPMIDCGDEDFYDSHSTPADAPRVPEGGEAAPELRPVLLQDERADQL